MAGLLERLDNLPFKGWHVRVLIILCLGLMFDAYDAFALSVALPQLIKEWHISTINAGYLASAAFWGMLVGALLSGILTDRFGRLRVFMISAAFYSVAMGLCVGATGFSSLLIYRILSGLGLGAMVPVSASYVAEFMPARVRGRALSIFNATYSLGVALAFGLGYWIIVPFGWRWAFIIGTLPVLLCLAAWMFLPESVRFLLQRKLVDRAVTAVDEIETKVIKKTTMPFDDAVAIENQTARKEVKVPIGYLFSRGLLRSTVLTSVMWFCLSFSTFSLVVWLPVLLTKALHYSLGKGLLWLAISQFIGVLVTPLAGMSADKFGRRINVFVLFVVFGISAYLLFFFGGLAGKFFMVVMMIFISMSNGINYVYVPENFPTAARGSGVGFASAWGRVGGALGPTVLGIIYGTSHSLVAVLNLNMALLLIAGLVVLIFGLETKGKTLEQINEARLVS